MIQITGAGAISPDGVGVDALLRWLEDPQPRLSSLEVLGEPWMPIPEGGRIPGWSNKVARAYVPDRKAIKLMTRPVQFGVAAAMEAWPEGAFAEVPPERRAMYVGSAVAVDEDWTFRDPINAAIVDDAFDMVRFAGPGHDALNPLWLVRGLSNNVLAFSALFRNIQGPNNNLEAGEAGPLIAVATAADALLSRKADVALAGGSESLASVEHIFHHHRHGADLVPGEAAGFLRLERGSAPGVTLRGSATGFVPAGPTTGPWLPEGTRARFNAVLGDAVTQAGLTPKRVFVGPRLLQALEAEGEDWSGTISKRMAECMGDAGAGSGGLLLALAWAKREHGPVAIGAGGPGGELAALVFGPGR